MNAQAPLVRRSVPRRLGVGVLSAAASAVCFGMIPFLAKAAYSAGADVSGVLFLRFSIAAAVMWACVAARRSSVPSGETLWMLMGMGALGYAGQAFAYFLALKTEPPAVVALLAYTYPVFVLLLSRLLRPHALTANHVGAVLTAVAGTGLTIGFDGRVTWRGALFGVTAAILNAGYILAGSRIPKPASSAASAAIVITAAALACGGFAGSGGVHLPTAAGGWFAILGLALISTVLAISLFLVGLKHVGPVPMSVLSTLEPATALGLSMIVADEPFSIGRLVGPLVTCCATIAISFERRGASRPHAAEGLVS